MKKICIVLCVFVCLAFTLTPTFCLPTNVVYLGGTPLGIVTSTNGAVVDSHVAVSTDRGAVYPARDAGILEGDIIVKIDDLQINQADDIKIALENAKTDTVKVEITRSSVKKIFEVTPELDTALSKKKIGVIVKNDIAGVGTLTFVKTSNMRFGALGHPIYDSKTNTYFDNGKVYRCNILGAIKGQSGKAGELRGVFNRGDDIIGKIDTNNFAGVYGTATVGMIENRPLIEVGGRKSVKEGKAQIYTTINGNSPLVYEVEIIRLVEQNAPAEKSMMIKVTDARLKEVTGGIVQGMSGSPIVQNGKLVGAVTHVLVNDPTRGYGIYADWMLQLANGA